MKRTLTLNAFFVNIFLDLRHKYKFLNSNSSFSLYKITYEIAQLFRNHINFSNTSV